MTNRVRILDEVAETRDAIMRELATEGPRIYSERAERRREQYRLSSARRVARFRAAGTCLDCGKDRDCATLRCRACCDGRSAVMRATRAAKRRERASA